MDGLPLTLYNLTRTLSLSRSLAPPATPEQVGCTMGLRSSVTAITFVALGTSLPDTFASKVGEIAGRSRGDRGEIVPNTLASKA